MIPVRFRGYYAVLSALLTALARTDLNVEEIYKLSRAMNDTGRTLLDRCGFGPTATLALEPRSDLHDLTPEELAAEAERTLDQIRELNTQRLLTAAPGAEVCTTFTDAEMTEITNAKDPRVPPVSNGNGSQNDDL